MTLQEKKESLIQTEWHQFYQVQNEGGRASCQEDPETFARTRRSQFAPWPEELVDSYARDLAEAEEEGRNLLTEKYAWMMEDTAPEDFARIRHLLPQPSLLQREMIDEIAMTQVQWMREYREKYPVLAAGNRALRARDAAPGETSFETYLCGELHTYSEDTLLLYRDMVRGLKSQGKNLSLLIMEDNVKAYGYQDLEDAEAKLSAKQRG